jgi:hypothetical protein
MLQHGHFTLMPNANYRGNGGNNRIMEAEDELQPTIT